VKEGLDARGLALASATACGYRQRRNNGRRAGMTVGAPGRSSRPRSTRRHYCIGGHRQASPHRSDHSPDPHRGLPEAVMRKFLGGGALASYLLLRDMPPGVDPLGPDNMLVLATSVINGLSLSGTNRY